MGSVVLDPVPPGSIDRFGLSIASATRDGTPRVGTIYQPQLFAAGVPVHFHPLGGSRFLGLFDGYWNAATPSTTTSGRYTAHTAVPGPAAVVIDAATGQISGAGGITAFALSTPDSRLISAASSSNFVMTLCTKASRAVLQHWSINLDGSLGKVGEYVLPEVNADGQVVRFDRGVYFSQPWIYLWGRGLNDDRIYAARQYVSKLSSPWLFQTDDGWSPTGATPVGTLTSLGPMSTAQWKGTTLVTTVATSGSNKVARLHSTRSMTDPWIQRMEYTIDSTAQWTGNGLCLQPQVASNPDAVGENTVAGIPWVRTTHVGSSGNESLVVSWGLYAVPSSLA